MSKEIRISEDGKVLKFVGKDCVDSDIVLPESVEWISNDAFAHCCKLVYVRLHGHIGSVGYRSFCGCINLTNISLPDSIENIDDLAFANCSGLANINLPPYIKSIGSLAFVECGSLININLPESINNVGSRAFHGCIRLKKINYKGTTYKIVMGDDNNPCVYEKSFRQKTNHNVITSIKVYSGVKWFIRITNGEVILDDCGFLVCDESRNLFYHAENKESAINGLFDKFENIRKGNAGKPTLTLKTIMTENDYISYTGACYGGVESFKSQYKERFNEECPAEFILKDLLPLLKSIRSYDMPRLLASSDNDVVEFWNTLK